MTKLLALLLLVAAGSGKIDKLWEKYDSFTQSDRPEDRISVLENIKKEASARHLTWDYYRACDNIVSVKTFRNWKERENSLAEMKRALESYGDAVALFRYHKEYGKGSAEEYISSNKKALEASSTPDFYKNDWSIQFYKFGQALTSFLKNDYEYAIWSIRDTAVIKSYSKGRYPIEAFYEYSAITGDGKEREKVLKEFSSKYKGHAAALLAEEDLLSMRLIDDKAGSDDFKRLMEDCRSFKAERDGFTGREKEIAVCCKEVDLIIEELERQDIICNVNDGKLLLSLKNVPAATVGIYESEGKPVWKKDFHNPAQSFHKMDSIHFDLPVLNDGEYKIEAHHGSVSASYRYRKQTLSAALRRDADGTSVLVADYLSGKPLDHADLELKYDNGRVRTINGMPLNGFTRIPETAEYKDSELKSVKCSVRDNGITRISGEISVYSYYNADTEDDIRQTRAFIITDRGAYIKGETIHFKTILYKGVFSLHCDNSAQNPKARLIDHKGNVIAITDLKTEGYGSADGSFTTPVDCEGGIYHIEITLNGNRIGSRSVRVDEFVTPTFDVTFDNKELFSREEDEISFTGTARSFTGHSLSSARATFTVSGYGSDEISGPLHIGPGGRFTINIPLPEDKRRGWYTATVRITGADGETLEFSGSAGFEWMTEVSGQSPYTFEELDGLGMKIIAGDKPVWAAVDLIGAGNRLLKHSIIYFEPTDGRAEHTVSFPYEDSYPDVVNLSVLYFQNGKCRRNSITRYREDHRYDLPLSFSRFVDKSAPGQPCRLEITTLPGTECAVSVYDKSTDGIMPGLWEKLRPSPLPAPNVGYRTFCGRDASEYAMPRTIRIRGAAAANAENDAIPFQMVETKAAFAGDGSSPNIQIRENFANTLYWNPRILSGKDGKASFSFTTADKLSTYRVQVFAHNGKMCNEVIDRDILVTIPVMVSIAAPQFLYSGDKYILTAALSNNSEKDVSGKLNMTLFDGDYRTGKILSSTQMPVTAPAGGVTKCDIPVDIPCLSTLGVKITFVPDDSKDGADALFTSIPVRQPVQTLTEAHSALYTKGINEESLIEALRKEFVNIPGNSASLSEISILEMIGNALPEEVKTDSDNSLELSKALYADFLCRKLGQSGCSDAERAAMKDKLLKCFKDDGGISWFEGMGSSPIVTAAVLVRIGGTQDLDIPESVLDKAVHYLDSRILATFKGEHPFFTPSIGQYLLVRSMHAGVPFNGDGTDTKTLRKFRKAASDYLTPSGARGLNGMILEKARRMKVLHNLQATGQGRALAGVWKVKVKRMPASEAADLESLMQYAVRHKSGGMYYPNAVMPWRGLLESELYAHSLLCDLLSSYDNQRSRDIADGIRTWIMVQKETQQWSDDPAYIEAIASVMNGSRSVLDTKVIVLNGQYTKEFKDIRASGNGMSIAMTREDAEPAVGDRIKLKFKITNDENRSFVHITLPYDAALRPVEQLSGYRRGAYRSVRAGVIEYWFESYPEEKTTITEEFFVTGAGSFQMPSPTIESLYAPHYSANSDAVTPITYTSR